MFGQEREHGRRQSVSSISVSDWSWDVSFEWDADDDAEQNETSFGLVYVALCTWRKPMVQERDEKNEVSGGVVQESVRPEQ
jgi:hypothetical protein